MSQHIEITLGEHKFKVSYFEFDQSVELNEPLKDMGSGNLKLQVKAAAEIIAMAISEHHPDMTPEKIRKIRAPIGSLFPEVNKILEFNGYDLSGKAAAAATA